MGADHAHVRRCLAAERSRARRAGMPLIQYAVSEWGHRRKRRLDEHAKLVVSIQWHHAPE